MYIPFFVGSPNICGYNGNNPDGFWSTLQQWVSFTSETYSNTTENTHPSLGIGLVDWPVEAWAQAATGNY
jgi:hypothetical protein